MPKTFKAGALALALGLATLTGVGAARPAFAAQPAATAGPSVTIDNFVFGPQALTIAVGTTVTWINQDDIPHTVVAADKSFKSRVLDTDERFSFTFTRAGEYGYFCSLHPHMTGKVIVTAG
ncbi:MAG TPA: cupredoxin family copper-binding protein [Phenylobacterium sp.]|jgi:plastocyanin|uniref:cupredoxin domain-containing protein n=1 Tax=Phenylobacterium sp. TaxID=1871053 RepID=UPI002C7311AD|nr:cupredoxin family copper-binding protein [Phenylobacterium sp.]HXA41223.1 cupredoxin family copper-binding protein [Phenylobacterium sp.]